MVEIDYYKKYLKYKQKYLKQKNLQIGGRNIKITIKIQGSPTLYENQEFESSKNIFTEIQRWLRDNNFNFTNFSLSRKVDYILNENQGYEKIEYKYIILKTFDDLKITDGEELLIDNL